MVFPVSVPVNEYSGLSRLPNNFHNHLRHNDLNDLDESHPQRQKVLPSRVSIIASYETGSLHSQIKCLVYQTLIKNVCKELLYLTELKNVSQIFILHIHTVCVKGSHLQSAWHFCMSHLICFW